MWESNRWVEDVKTETGGGGSALSVEDLMGKIQDVKGWISIENSQSDHNVNMDPSYVYGDVYERVESILYDVLDFVGYKANIELY